jgi:hypothetical protein
MASVFGTRTYKNCINRRFSGFDRIFEKNVN